MRHAWTWIQGRGRLTCATAPARAPESMRCPGVISSISSHTQRLMRSLQDSLMAVSGAILITLVPLPRKKALIVPAQHPLAAVRPCPSVGLLLCTHLPEASSGCSKSNILGARAGCISFACLHADDGRGGCRAGGAPSAAMRPQPSRTVRPRAVLSTCSSSFMRSTGAVAVLLTAPATPAEHARAAPEKLGWLSAGAVDHPSTPCMSCRETEAAHHAAAGMQPVLWRLLKAAR